METRRDFFSTRAGFVMAAAGSAVGLGNMWRFPYQAAESGGAAFVILYIAMTFLVGVPIMTSELIIGRRSRLSPIGALRRFGGRFAVPIGYLVLLTPLIILSYFSVITGWTLSYAIDALSGFADNPAERYSSVSSGMSSVAGHLVLMGATIAILLRGVRRGIEVVSLVLMPTLLVLLIGMVIWAASLPGSAAGYEYYLRPSLSAMTDIEVIRQAAAQSFLSLSVGMGVMITYASYLRGDADIGKNAVTVSMLDFSVAFIGGLLVFPVVFALGMSDQIGESTIGALFISLPAGFSEISLAGQFVGFVFFSALFVAGLTSAISLLEVTVSWMMDEFGLSRARSVWSMGGVATVLGLAPALSQTALGTMDKYTSEILVVVGALASVILAGWYVKGAAQEIQRGASPLFSRLAPVLVFAIRYPAPIFVGVILWFGIDSALR